ncbi:diguanylate cyclase [Arthrobacter sp. HS15c]|uniref:sensor domain-containing diguanylate cyclase n=1 Tax=Arthrobacter sp. HS15c TaxID=3230279 RepID=UPI0034657DAE
MGHDAALFGLARTVMLGHWDRQFRTIHATDAITGWIGHTPGQIRGLHLRDIVGDEFFADAEPYLRAVLSGEPQAFGRRIANAAGQTRHVQVTCAPDTSDGGVRGFFVFITDVTGRVAAERIRQRDAERYRALAASIPGVFVLLFDSELRYIIAEGQELAAFGYSAAELEGRTIFESVEPGLARELEPRYRAALAGQEVSWTRRIGPRTFSLTSRPVQSDEGISAGMVVALDITDRVHREKTWAALHDIATAVARSASPEDVATRVAAVLRRLFSVDSAAVVRFAGDSQAEIVAMAPELPANVSRTHQLTPEDSSATARVAFTGKPALVSYDGAGGLGDQMLAGGFLSGAGAPIRVNGGLWGTIVLTSRSSVGVTPAMLDRLAEFADLVEIAVGNSEAWAALEHKASTDPLTGLLNRRALEKVLSHELDAATAASHRISLIVLDIDNFKSTNDLFGHQAGDDVLVEVVRRLQQATGDGEILARFGGEEFVWLLPGTGGEDALKAAERARRLIAAIPFPGVGALTISAGVCELADTGGEPLIACADQALYRAKSEGRNNSVRYVSPG